MRTSFIFLLMVFLHIVDDYYLQGMLADLKQKSWWKGKGKKYENDYLVALIMHGFSWSFLVCLPLFFLHNFNNPALEVALLVNAVIHSLIDNMKANDFSINLVVDQSLHIIQILILYVIFI